MEQKVFEEYEQAVMAEQREKVTSGNFDRHVDKMVSAYQKMKKDIEAPIAPFSYLPERDSLSGLGCTCCSVACS